MTLSNEQADNNFTAGAGSLFVLREDGVSSPTDFVTGFDMSFSQDVQLISHDGGSFLDLEGDESLTFTVGSSTSIENAPWSSPKNFTNQMIVPAKYNNKRNFQILEVHLVHLVISLQLVVSPYCLFPPIPHPSPPSPNGA